MFKRTRGNDLETYSLSAPSKVNSLDGLFPFGRLDRKKWNSISNGNDYIELKFVNQSEEEQLKGKEDQWSYYLNRYNFRNKWNFNDTRKKIGFFGCSFTFGEGIHNDDTFVDIVSKKCNLNPFNLGVGGAGIERVARTFSAAVRVIDFDFAVVTLPAWHRQLHVDELGQMINIIPGWPHSGFEKINELLTKADEDFYINHAISYITWIVDVAQSHNIKILLSSWDHPTNELTKILYPDITLKPFPNIDDKCARDKMHPGTKSQKEHAKQIIEAFNDKTWI